MKESASSRNALKHGLAADKLARQDKERIASLIKLFKEERSGPRIEQAAQRAAEAREYLERVIATRDTAFAALPEQEKIEGRNPHDPETLIDHCVRLERLERYERRATVEWERALAELELALLDEERAHLQNCIAPQCAAGYEFIAKAPSVMPLSAR